MFNPFFNPSGVAVIGASRDPHKLGHGVVRNLMEYHYRGSIYPVNPVASEILGQVCYPSLIDVPGQPIQYREPPLLTEPMTR
jgi:acyl-CoA synthetase (NDP forming)